MDKWLLISFMFVTALISSSKLIAAESCVLNARVVNIPPLYIEKETGDWTGLVVDLAKVLLDEAGCKGHFQTIPWKRALTEMQSGQLDMMMNLSMTQDRKEFIHFIGPQSDELVRLFLKQDIKIDINSLDDLKKIPGQVGYQKGTFLGREFEEKLETDPDFRKKFRVIHASQLNIKMLSAGRISGFIGQSYSGVSLQHEFMNKNGFEIHPYIINQDFVYFGFSKKNVPQELLLRLEHAYEKAKREGKFDLVSISYK